MRINCPRGWKSVTRIDSNIRIEDHIVNICNDVCSSDDLCGNEDCRFNDMSGDATGRFLKGLYFEQTLQFRERMEELQEELEMKAAIEKEIHEGDNQSVEPEDDIVTVRIMHPE